VLYIFQGGDRIAKVKVSSNDRKITVATEQTKFMFIPLEKTLFKTRQEQAMLRILHMIRDRADDELFEKYIISEFAKMGYSLKSKNQDE